jgi:hypothetical protein
MSKKLAKADFFVMRDMRGATRPKHAYDPDPVLSEKIKADRIKFYPTIAPDWAPGQFQADLFHRLPQVEFRMPPELVLKRIAFKEKTPEKGLDHNLSFGFVDYASVGIDKYYVVSPEWRAAVESLEDVHEFFPYVAEFKDKQISRWIFRAHQNATNEFRSGLENVGDWKKYRALFPLDAVKGKHLFLAGWSPSYIVSRELATLLLPLLPRFVNFYPIMFDV